MPTTMPNSFTNHTEGITNVKPKAQLRNHIRHSDRFSNVHLKP